MRFIVAVDGSDESEEALRYGIRVADGLDASVDVVYVVKPEIYSEEGRVLIEDMSDAEGRAEKTLEEARAIAEDEGFDDVRTEELYGDAPEEIADHAETADADGIFIGHRGISEQYEGAVGSVAQELVRRATVPVTVVR